MPSKAERIIRTDDPNGRPADGGDQTFALRCDPGAKLNMFDQILGLILTILGLIYLGYAMLRPEKF
jgi:K+-transporting ATPase KdpF subunit